MAPKPDDDPYAHAPAYPEDAAYFVLTADGAALTTSITAVISHAGDDLDTDKKPDQIEEVRRQIPDHAERLSNPDSFAFPAGEPIPALFVNEQTWNVNHSRLVALDGEGQPLDDARPETEAERVARRAMPKIADRDANGDTADDAGEQPADPLADVTADDLADLEYHALRGLAQSVEGIDGNATREEIEDALADELREREQPDDADVEQGAKPA